MANLLKVAMLESIVSLYERGWSQRRIAVELEIDRGTVSRHLKQSGLLSKPASAERPEVSGAGVQNRPAPTGSGESASSSKPASAHELEATSAEVQNQPAPTGSAGPLDLSERHPSHPNSIPSSIPAKGESTSRRSECEPWREVILEKYALGLHGRRIHQDLAAEHGFRGSYYSVLRFIRRHQPRQELPFRRMECDPGEEAQVDFGTGAPIVMPDGKRRRTHVFRIVLSHSRKAYSEVVYRQTTAEFIRVLENAFWHFGGVPQRLVLDNLRAAVKKADWFEPELNPQVRSFGLHYGCVFMPAKPYMPRHKGKVERGIDYVQENGLRGRAFPTLEEENLFLLDWERTVADVRVHGTTRRQVGSHFAEAERSALLPLPLERFPCFREGQRIVHRDGHVEIDRAYYSVPPEYMSRRVWVRWDGRLVRIFTEKMIEIACHVKHESGRFSTQSQHIAGAKINSVERGAAWLLARIRPIGERCLGWAEAVIENRGVEGVRVLQGLLNLASRHPSTDLERACDIALSYGSHHLRTIRTLLKRPAATRQEALPFMDEHPLIRDLADYGQFVHDAFQKEVES
jgi:transposase